MLFGQVQNDITRLGIGASGFVYEVDEHIFFKAPIINRPPGINGSSLDHYFYATDAVFRFEDFENERAIFRHLRQHPHPNIVQAIAIEYPEGIYLRKYHPLLDCPLPSPIGQNSLVHRHASCTFAPPQLEHRPFGYSH
jgi:hypothetical protein